MVKTPINAVLLFGMPGAGKGTQGKILGSIPGFVHVSTGDIFRSLDKGSRLGRVFMEYSSRGELVPDDVTIEIFQDDLKRRVERGALDPERDIALLDGIPRNVRQAQLLDGSIRVRMVVHLTFGDSEVAVARLKGRALEQNRADDAREDVIRRRLEVYNDETRPVLACYDASMVKAVDAVGTPAEVLARILGHLAPLQASAGARKAMG